MLRDAATLTVLPLPISVANRLWCQASPQRAVQPSRAAAAGWHYPLELVGS